MPEALQRDQDPVREHVHRSAARSAQLRLVRARVYLRSGVRLRRVCRVDACGRLHDVSVRALRSLRARLALLSARGGREVRDVRHCLCVPVSPTRRIQ